MGNRSSSTDDTQAICDDAMRMFHKMDHNLDEVITKDEWTDAFSMLDDNGDDTITRKSWYLRAGTTDIFDAIPKQGAGAIRRREWSLAFEALDTDRSGTISIQEWQSAQEGCEASVPAATPIVSSPGGEDASSMQGEPCSSSPGWRSALAGLAQHAVRLFGRDTAAVTPTEAVGDPRSDEDGSRRAEAAEDLLGVQEEDSDASSSDEDENEEEEEEEEDAASFVPRPRSKRSMMEKCSNFRLVKSPAFQEWGEAAYVLKQEVPIPKRLRFHTCADAGSIHDDLREAVASTSSAFESRASSTSAPSDWMLGSPVVLERAITSPYRAAEAGQEDVFGVPDSGPESFVCWPPRRRSSAQKSIDRFARRSSRVSRRKRGMSVATALTDGSVDAVEAAFTDARKKRVAELVATQYLRSFAQRAKMRVGLENAMNNRRNGNVRHEADSFNFIYARCLDEMEATELSFRRPKRAHTVDMGEAFSRKDLMSFL